MNEHEKEVIQEDNNIYMQQIEELKTKMDTMIDPDEYKRLEEERNKLLNDYVNKRPAPVIDVAPTYSKEDVENLAKQLTEAKDITNIDYVKLSLEHREAMLAVYDKDPYGLNGEKSADTEAAANFYKSLLEESSTPSQFRMRFEEYTKDDPTVIQKLRAARQSRDKGK